MSQAVVKSDWWVEKTGERFWLEITNRPDLGMDLNAPQSGASGKPHHAYSLITKVEPGDIVFHYDTNSAMIVAASRVAGPAYPAEVVWGSQANAVAPFARPGWRVALEAYCPLRIPLTLEDLRRDAQLLSTERDSIKAQGNGATYFPFEISGKRPLRLTQSYLTKLPATIVRRYPTLESTAQELTSVRDQPPLSPREIAGELGTDYRSADEAASISRSDPFLRDPALVERAHRGHARTQNALAEAVRVQGFTPRSAAPLEPNFDLAWEADGRIFVAEVKSLTATNEEKQLRLGVGQVLRYRQVLARSRRPVIAVLALERKPSDPTWEALCNQLQIRLLWPETFSALF